MFRLLAFLVGAAITSAAPVPFEVAPRAITRFDAPLPPKAQKLAAIGGNVAPIEAKCAVAVPDGFNPARPWPILVWNAAQNSSAVDALTEIAPTVNGVGWVLLAADGGTPAKLETTEWCTAMLAAAIDKLERSWPTVRRWPMASGGFSGGSKRAPYLGAVLLENRYRVIGIFLGGCNEDRATDALRWHKPGPAFQHTPIFLSGGAQDRTANPDEQEAVAASLKKSGFIRVRRESFDGGHELHAPHLAEALRWFVTPAAR